MVEIKIQCDCGVRYKFDVEPLNGRMPVRVRCPGCGGEGTDAANARLREILAAPVRTATAGSPTVTNPDLIGTPGTAEAVEVEVVQPLRGLTRSTGAGAGRTVLPAGGTPAQPFPRRSPRRAIGSPNLALGVVGAVLAGGLAMLGWFLALAWTGYEIGFAAWGVGVLTGLGTRLLGRAGSRALGTVAGVCALLAMVGGQVLAIESRLGAAATWDGLRAQASWLTLLWLLLAVASAQRIAAGRWGRRSLREIGG